MQRSWIRMLAIGAVMTAIGALSAADADAGWWHRHHRGWGSYGSYGSYGCAGSYGCYGGYSSYGGWGSHGSYGGCYGSYGAGYGGGYGHHCRLFGRRNQHVASNYYWGGSYGGYGSWGYGGSYGSQGGSYYFAPSQGMEMYEYPAEPGVYEPAEPGVVPDTIPATPATPTTPATPDVIPEPSSTSSAASRALLTVVVPEDAEVFVNGQATTSTGSERTYVSHGLRQGSSYRYEVRAVAYVDGQRREETRSVRLVAGARERVEFTMAANTATAQTTLQLHVPDDAQVFLADNPTRSRGELRVFKTSQLEPGQQWDNYRIRVTVDRDGRELTQEKSITLKAGDTQSLTFNFTDNQVADSR